jgi:hypothetical protein
VVEIKAVTGHVMKNACACLTQSLKVLTDDPLSVPSESQLANSLSDGYEAPPDSDGHGECASSEDQRLPRQIPPGAEPLDKRYRP